MVFAYKLKNLSSVSSRILCVALLVIISLFVSSHSEGAEIIQIEKSDLVKKFKDGQRGKVVVVFTSWCGYCKRAMPVLSRLFPQKGEDGSSAMSADGKYDLFLISADDNIHMLNSVAKLAMSSYDMQIYFVQNGEVGNALSEIDISGIKSVPHMVVFERDGDVDDIKVYDGAVNENVIRNYFQDGEK